MYPGWHLQAIPVGSGQGRLQGGGAAETSRLRDELQSLQAERKQVRNRIEKLLGQIDQLSAG